MINIKKFEFKKSYEEVELAGKTYKIEFNDEKLLEYSKAFDNFYQEIQDINKVDTSDMDAEEQEEIFKDMQKIIKSITDVILGVGSYDTLYEQSGQSIMNMVYMIEFLSDVVGERMEQSREEKKQRYVKKNV